MILVSKISSKKDVNNYYKGVFDLLRDQDFGDLDPPQAKVFFKGTRLKQLFFE